MKSFSVDKIGVALAAYQPHFDYFYEQLKSIQNQTYKNWICAVTFDSSPDPYLNDLRYDSIWSDERFQVIKNPSQLGAKLNFQASIQAVVSKNIDAFACADQDDVWSLNKLEVCRQELLKHGRESLVHCDMYVFMKQNDLWKNLGQTAWQIEKRGIHNSKPEDFLIRNTVAGAAMLADAELARRYPSIPEDFPYHDHWYAMVAACHGGVYSIREPLYQYRQHGNNVLGLREYKGFISARDRLWNPVYVYRKLRQKYEWSLKIARACEDNGLLKGQALSFVQQDLMRYILLAFQKYKSDPALSRALLARGLGRRL